MVVAHRIADLAAHGPISRTAIYRAIKAGRLVARKVGRTTVILDEDWTALIAAAPAAKTDGRQAQSTP